MDNNGQYWPIKSYAKNLCSNFAAEIKSDGNSVVDHEGIAIAGGAVAVEGFGGARLRHAAIVEVVDALTARAGGHALEVDGEAR